MIDAICGAVYGWNGNNFGLKFRAFNLGKRRFVKSRAFAIPMRIKRESRCIDHSKRL